MAGTSDFKTYGIKPNSRPAGELELSLRCWVRRWRSWREEFETHAGVPWTTQAWAWRKGFHSSNACFYGLDDSTCDSYLGDYEYAYRSYRFNGFFSPIVGNKWVVSQVLAGADVPCPEVVGLLLEGVPLDPRGRRQSGEMMNVLRSWCEGREALVLRPHWSGSGEGVFFLAWRDGTWLVNWQEAPGEFVARLIGGLHRYMVTAWVAQADFARTIFPRTTNTLRVLTLRDEDGPFVAAAVHRFGSERSYPIDNFHAGFGGFCASVDVHQQCLGQAVSRGAGHRAVWHAVHPQSRQPIEGVRIPHLTTALTGLLQACDCFPEARLIGWDVILTNEGFHVVEANSPPGIVVWQVHQPLLTEPRAARFFAQHGFSVPRHLLP